MSLSVEEQLVFNYFKVAGASEAEETEKVLREIRESSGNAGGTEKTLGDVVTSINRVIKNYDLEIAEATDELSAKKVHCLIATNDSTVAQRASFYSKQACELLSKIIQECVLTGCGYVSEIRCLNLSTSVKSNKTSMQTLLQTLIRDKWLVSEDGKISLGMRCQLELELTIKKQYPEYVKHCSLCRQFMMQGFTCRECESHAHFYCVKKYYKINKLAPSSKTCPICKEETGGVVGGEVRNAVNGVGEPPAKKRKSQG